jgi:hypothetical protein
VTTTTIRRPEKMKPLTPDEIHAAISGVIITLNPHPSNAEVVMMTADNPVIVALRSMPTAPQLWYSASDSAYLLKARDSARLVKGLRSFGGIVVGNVEAAVLTEPEPGKRRPPWCGECDGSTRLVRVEGGLGRCPRCHPLRAEPVRHREPEPEPSVEEYQAGVRRVREELRRLRAGRPYEVRHGEPVLVGELVNDDDDEAHPF